ncbi:MAG: tyrosinase family protein [Methylococcaceae bacterium]
MLKALLASLLLISMSSSYAQDRRYDPLKPNVKASSVIVRKNVKNMTAAEKADFVGAILKLKITPVKNGYMVGNVYDYFVATHMSKLVCWSDQTPIGGLGHSAPDLLTWHRAFLLEFENALSKAAGKPIAIPYWDWTDPDSERAMLSDDMMGPSGKKEDDFYVMSGPFRKNAWTLHVKAFKENNPGQFNSIVRATGTMEGAMSPPSEADVQALLSRPYYDVAPWGATSDSNLSFRNYFDGGINATGFVCNQGTVYDVEGATSTRLHAQGHMYIGGANAQGQVGSLSDTATSPNDPVFWLHHANVDRVAELWWKAHNYQYLPKTGGPNGTNINDPIWPYVKLTNGRMARPTTAFGYRYAPTTPSGSPVVHARDRIMPMTMGHLEKPPYLGPLR